MRETVTTTPVVEDDVVERLRQGTVQRKRRWSGDTHMDEGGPCDEEATDALMSEAAALIERLQKELKEARDSIESEHAEAMHWARLAMEDPGANGPRLWKDIAAELRTLLSTLMEAVEPFAKTIETEEALDIPPLKLVTIQCGAFRDYSLTIDNFRALLEAYLKAKER